MKKRILLTLGILSVFLFLTGCTEITKPIDANSTGFWNEYIVYPLSWLIVRLLKFLAELWFINYCGDNLNSISSITAYD